MARLHEHQGKRILNEYGIATPQGAAARSVEERREIAEELGKAVVIKAQVYGTSRAASGGIRFADSPDVAARIADEMLGATIGGAVVEAVLVEEALPIAREFYLGCIVDDRLRRPVMLLSAAGGSGIEERTGTMAQVTASVRREPLPDELLAALNKSDTPEEVREALADVWLKLYRVARNSDARVAEINPLALLQDGRLVALDCRISVDDYAVFRHDDFGIEIAREIGHTPTELDRIAWEVEKDDYRGTFYFVELPQKENAEGIAIGFHGAGGGGSMASMDAALRAGLRPVDYVDTSGNPAASKVYRAAKIILRQQGIRGYFMSGSGVASQEQFHLARALVKAFREARLSIPAVLRLGGNGEEIAARIISDYTNDLPAPVEAYQKRHSADFCANRLKELIEQSEAQETKPQHRENTQPQRRELRQSYSFETRTGQITYDHAICAECESKACVKECPPQILSLENQLPVLNITLDEAKRGKCIECLACEVECWFQGKGGAVIELPIGGLSGG